MECKQRLKWLMLAMICPLIAGAPSSMSKSDNSCPKENLNITGGSFVLSNGYSHGSLLKYICPYKYYPTVQSRLCQGEQWNPKPKIRKPAECKKITCPNPRVFINGEVIPFKDKYYVNDTTTYSCHSDYMFRGSAVRVCKPNGKWSGSTPICGPDHCPDPGVPPGSGREGNIFNIDDKVTYRCERPLTLIGSKVRVCQDGGQWSGTEPQCYADFTYDTAEEASEAFSSSLKSNLAVSQHIEPEDFENAKTTIKLLIEKISYYPVSPNYEILIFATDVTPIIQMRNFKLNKNERSLERIFEDLDKFTYDSKGGKTGTNIAKVYSEIYESMQIEKVNNAAAFNETQHIIILFTDGQANMGGNPKPKVDQIKHLVTKNDPSQDKKLDLYLFGVGTDVNQEDINDLVSQRDQEKFFFKLKDLTTVQEMFDDMIAAHCFNEGDTPDNILVKLEKDLVVKVKQYVLHPKYNITAKKHMGIQEYYEFDVALIQLEKPVKMTTNARPICIPCTKETNAALKLSESEGTCRKHEEILMSNELVEAAFTSDMDTDNSPKTIKRITIKLGKYRDACVEDAKKAKGINVENAREVVTDNFLCSGGTEPETDDVACKGESGGATYLNKKGRVIQVGVISWGAKDICKEKSRHTSVADSRDYHSNLFSEKIRSFLKEHLEKDTIGNPLTFL
ncbi:Complement factor B [Labeo rohita]|uniref:C3/C5 convertase n=1 Tax=Labeo rohita TaxID=84645 RepID=A0ABQ8LKT5_LABRO|nr:Complement factor B [Labeo rohita]